MTFSWQNESHDEPGEFPLTEGRADCSAEEVSDGMQQLSEGPAAKSFLREFLAFYAAKLQVAVKLFSPWLFFFFYSSSFPFKFSVTTSKASRSKAPRS